MYHSTKTYGHELGFSACFRQWRADSHCKLLHGYALSFTFVFHAQELDHRNWVVDFGGLKMLKLGLEGYFDHKLLVAEDDPYRETFETMSTFKLAEVRILPKVGCEAFAELGWRLANETIRRLDYYPRVRVFSCEVHEHGANSAIYLGSDA